MFPNVGKPAGFNYNVVWTNTVNTLAAHNSKMACIFRAYKYLQTIKNAHSPHEHDSHVTNLWLFSET